MNIIDFQYLLKEIHVELKSNKTPPDILQLNSSVTAVSEVELYKPWSG